MEPMDEMTFEEALALVLREDAEIIEALSKT